MADDQAQSKQEHKDFFISYTSADRRWAEWIAWHLEEAGYSTMLQAWDFHAGGNFVLDMDTATRQTERTIAVLSADYFASRFTPSEWTAAFRRDPRGEQGILLPIRVRSCEVEGLLGQISYIDLVDQSEQEALTALLAKVQRQRLKPVQAPTFPSTSQPDRFPGALPALWMVPFRHNRLFTGRETMLLQLHETLTRGKRVALTQVISGLGGIGKTQVAIEYAYRYFSEYQAVFWMHADSQPSILSSFLEMADLLQLPERKEQETALIVSAVQRWSRSHPGWLLIVDNADELDLVQPFLPEGQGQIILTSRNQITRGMADETLPLDVMNAEEGALLLLRCAKRVRSDQPLGAISEQELAEAKKLVDTLGGLPLALDQAGAYMEATGCSVAAYLALCQQRRNYLLKQRGTLSSDYPQSVATTWSLSFQNVEQKNPAAADLLRLCAFLAPDAIPEEIITKGCFSLRDSFLYRIRHLFSQQRKTQGLLRHLAMDTLAFNQSIEALRAYSLLHREVNSGTAPSLSVHRLVQAVILDQMDEHDRHQWTQRAVQAINAAFPESGAFDHWNACAQYLPHVLIVYSHLKTERMVLPEAAEVLRRAGWYLGERGQQEEAEELLQHALMLQEQNEDRDKLALARAALALAWLYNRKAKYIEAEPLFQRALSIYEQQLGAQHPHTATSLDNLAALYQAQGKYEQAEPLCQRALSISEQQVGAQHPHTATSLNNLAELYQAQGKYEQAEPLYQRALAIREQQVGPLHPNTATSLNNLAELYQAQGKYEQAEPLLQRALAIREQQVGPLHPDTALSVWWLATLSEQQQQYGQAASLYQRALAIDEHALGPQHPTTQRIRANYARLLRTMGHDAEAAALDQP